MEEIKNAWELDRLERSGVAKFLKNYIDLNNHIKVLNINSPWGSGKTFFLTNWFHELKEERACVYFNAWENDFTGDAFISLTAAIKDQLEEQSGEQQELKDQLNKFVKAASTAIIAATPILAKGLVKKFTGVDCAIVEETIGNESLGDAAEKAIEKIIENNKDTIDQVKNFKEVFSRLLSVAADMKSNASGLEKHPVYIFIDELDRCRPSFAIELLERVKHFFELDGCRFIIATDTEQLSHSVKAVYGEGYDGRRYLKRFFDAEFELPDSNISDWISANFDIEVSQANFLLGFISKFKRGNGYYHGYGHLDNTEPDKNAVIDPANKLNEPQLTLLGLALTFGTQLRELTKIIGHISAIRNNIISSHSNKNFHLFWSAYMVFLRDADPAIYKMYLSGDNRWLEKAKIAYPSKCYYLGYANLDIHELAGNYITALRSGREFIRKILNSQGNQPYLINVYTEIFNNEEVFKDCIKLVTLSKNLDVN